ncbi:homocysteine S-methyltransferase family protein [Geminicoccaceae bacterium 1502E]|nr:homocysteine S-methyltransferase family protein [Geminicoccaceae bacterium 1502E]
MTDLATMLKARGVLLMDGGMGQELRRRSPLGDHPLWSAKVMAEQPGLVRALHREFIDAGARVIITNTYATSRHRLAAEGMEERFAELVTLGGRLACEARAESGREVLVAGSLPPLHGSYRPDLVRSFEEIAPVYREHAELLAPHVDLLLCETMSSAEEARAAAHAAATTGKPVWVAWTLKDGGSTALRSGESLDRAWAALDGIPVEAVLVNCCSPESITAAMPELAALGPPAGAYANGFAPIPKDWLVTQGTARLGHRDELTPEAYCRHAARWIETGARIVGGCCEVGPEHIRAIREMLEG